ncbi:type II toxin-antitoxin system RelE/ParE family toxin [Sphingobium sp. DEHP117]|uniref:type II toxin-antitoxin system RelE/ParE family toxin n=1 Tax=Sphingobium sp. DEHP117 TaxID=2993436 RepID=UPI0027D68398|nr:type II toxin-antitoxin system RelE/ParE family toxin [Sphingobium sp. DEHP117]MDQ4420971.1 type II toxin-antitoxin system RelE/ParE family toxin [Sphingobium sp. DEHP117]
MTDSYVLSSAAEADLRDIVRYTRKQWGDTQTRTYMAKIKAGIEHIAGGQGVFKDISALHPGLRVTRCEHHYIFCLPRADAPALIVALFHERMDLMTRLADRMK